MEGAVRSFEGEELPPLQGREGTPRAFTGTSELTHQVVAPLSLFFPPLSAFLQHFQNEASAPQRRSRGSNGEEGELDGVGCWGE